jgi:hypothetical protein
MARQSPRQNVQQGIGLISKPDAAWGAEPDARGQNRKARPNEPTTNRVKRGGRKLTIAAPGKSRSDP